MINPGPRERPQAIVRETIEGVTGAAIHRLEPAHPFELRLARRHLCGTASAERTKDFDRMYGVIAPFMRTANATIPGCLGSELFGSRDHKSHAQWNERLGTLLEDITATRQTLHFSLYTGDWFAAPQTLGAR